MRFSLPFTYQSVMDEIAGRVSVSLNARSDPAFELWEDIDIQEGGIISGGKDVKSWTVTPEGVLEMCDSDGMAIFRMTGLEMENGDVFITGNSQHHAAPYFRAVMHKVVRLGEDFEVVISTHVDYVEKTIPRLVRSLEREGIGRDRITIVVGGAKEDDMAKTDKCYVKESAMGFTGLIPFLNGTLTPKKSHILLLHDTCEASLGFGEMARGVDVGLPFDVILLMPRDMRMEMGFWSRRFIDRLRSTCPDVVTASHSTVLFNRLMGMARLVAQVDGRWNKGFRELRSRDIYGQGVERSVLESETACLKKFRAARGVIGKA